MHGVQKPAGVTSKLRRARGESREDGEVGVGREEGHLAEDVAGKEEGVPRGEGADGGEQRGGGAHGGGTDLGVGVVHQRTEVGNRPLEPRLVVAQPTEAENPD